MATLFERNAAFITSRHGFTVFIVSTLVILGLIRSFLFPGVGGDDGEQLVFSQFLSWGYQIRNPPMVTWMLIALQSVTGPTVFSIVALRTVILIAIYLLSFSIGERLFDDRRLAALSAGSLLMIFYMGWNTIHGFTHTALVTVFYLSALGLVLRIRESSTPLGLISLGIVLSLGLMAKYSFLIFAAAVLAAGLMDQEFRRHLRLRWLFLGILIPLPIVVPQLQWLWAHAPKAHLIAADPDYSVVDIAFQKAKGLLRLVPAAIGFLMPMGILWVAVFWGPVRGSTPPSSHLVPTLKLFERVFIALLASAVIAILFIQSDRLRSHYMFVLVPLVPYLFLRFGHRFREIEIRRYAALVSLSALALIGSLVGKYFIEPLVCGHCEDHIPYDDFARQIREAGFTGGTIFAYFHKDPLAGNFRVRFPNDRIVSAKHPSVIPPARKKSGQCLIIWPVKGAVEPKSATIRTANNSGLQTNLSYDLPSRVLTAFLPPYASKPHRLEYILLKEGAGGCR